MDRASIRMVAIAALLPLLLLVNSSAAIPPSSAINAVLGDESFIQAFGFPPGPQTDEDLRIRTHLAYVEALLAACDVRSWPAELQVARARNLERLREYRGLGSFPRNYDHPGVRKPCFIDREGRICAAGYLIEQSAGCALAEAINSRYQYAYIDGMDMQELETWIAQSGLSKLEVAMIQPCYGCPERTLCMRITGRTWSPGEAQPGKELHLVGTISPTEGMFSHIPTAGELTFYLGDAVFERHEQESIWEEYEYSGGTFGVYEDAASSAQFGVDPPNATSPVTFVDGSPLATGQVQFLSIYYYRASAYYSLIGEIYVTGGEHARHFAPSLVEVYGALSPAALPGYDFTWQGEMYGYCTPMPVEPATWGRIKGHYR